MLSVITVSHDPEWLERCAEALAEQTRQDWEWLIVGDTGRRWSPPVVSQRVTVISAPRGASLTVARRFTSESARGDILVEVDRGQLLAPEALESLGRALESSPEAVLAYSNWVQVHEPGAGAGGAYDPALGWETDSFPHGGREVEYIRAMDPTPHNIASPRFAPDGVRAMRAEAYRLAGGDSRSPLASSDDELLARLFVAGEFVHVDECLYLRGGPASEAARADVGGGAPAARSTAALYDERFERMAIAWAGRWDLDCVELRRHVGTPQACYTSSWEVSGGADPIDALRAYPDHSLGVVKIDDVLSDVADPVLFFNELYRVLSPGGVVITATPSADMRGAGGGEPAARSRWNADSFSVYTDDAHPRRVPAVEARFQVSRAVTEPPTASHRDAGLDYVFVDLICAKPGMSRNGGIMRTR